MVSWVSHDLFSPNPCCKSYRRSCLLNNCLLFSDEILLFSGIHVKLYLTWENQQFAYAKTKAQISFAVTAKLISAFVFATRVVQSLYFLNTKFHASSCLLLLCSSVCVGPGRKPHCWFSHEAAHLSRDTGHISTNTPTKRSDSQQLV